MGRRKRKNYRIKHNRPAGFGDVAPIRAKPDVVDATPRGRARPLGGRGMKSDDNYNSWGRPAGFRY